MSERSSAYGVHAIQIGRWKKAAVEGMPRIFKGNGSPKEREQKVLIERLYGKIGEVEVGNDWLKKKVSF